QLANLLLGLSPSILHWRYLADKARFNLSAKITSSTMIACNLCTGVAAAEAIKILLHRGKVHPMPYYQVFDAYTNRYIRGKVIGGARNPLFRLKTRAAHRRLERLTRNAPAEPPAPPATA